MNELEIKAGTDIAQLFSSGGLHQILSRIEEEARSLVPDIGTKKGRGAIASMAAKVARSKTYLDRIGKELTAELKAQTGAVDRERREMRDRLDALKEEVRKPLTDWEQSEADRIAALQRRIRDLAETLDGGADSADIEARIEYLESVVIDETWQEFQAEAARTKDGQLRLFRADLVVRRKQEAEAAEQERQRQEEEARLQAERDARIAAEAAERATREAEERAKAEAQRVERERLEQERRVIEAQRQAVEAEQRRIREAAEAEARAKAMAEASAKRERDRIEREQAAAAERERKRAADLAHRNAILWSAVDDLAYLAGFELDGEGNRELFRWVIDQIAACNVRGVRIEY